jgi:hypothetical protein
MRQFLGLASRPAFQSRLGSILTGIGLIRQDLFLGLGRLHIVNGFLQDALVLELITLAAHIERMVNMLVNLFGIAHLFEQAPQDARPTHPNHFEWQARIGAPATFSRTYCGHVI